MLAKLAQKRPTKQGTVSRFGTYQGYTNEGYEGSQRLSDYLTLSDGTRLAYDLILPTKRGVPADRPLPVLFKYTPYLRTWTIFDTHGKSNLAELEALPWYAELYLRVRSWLAPHGNILDPLWRTKWLGNLVKSGYAVVVVERPGTGASFGTYSAFDTDMAREANEILNWIVAQNWCDGNIGMYGDSAQAQVQFAAASTGNPHLKALFAESTWMDIYNSFMYPGGIYDKSFSNFYVLSQKLLDSNMATPVDRDRDGSELEEAKASRHGGTIGEAAVSAMTKYPFRDSLTTDGHNLWEAMALYPLLEQINRSAIPVYLINGWPVQDQGTRRFYFGAEETEGATSVKHGTLVLTIPTASEAADSYTVDYSTTTGKKARWTAVNWVHQYPNMRANDAKALTYTTVPLLTAVQVCGHPVVHVWVTSDTPDVDVFAYLEEVDAHGNSTYITEGNLRASHRRAGQAPYENLGLPYHTHFQSELESIPAGEPVELVFDLLPTAYQFQQGRRIRLALTCADADNFDTPTLKPAPRLQVLRDTSHPSFVDLPIAQEGKAPKA